MIAFHSALRTLSSLSGHAGPPKQLVHLVSRGRRHSFGRGSYGGWGGGGSSLAGSGRKNGGSWTEKFPFPKILK